MGDTAQFGGVRASCREARHDARGLRLRRQSNSDNNGTPQAAGDRATSDTHARTERVPCASGVTRTYIGSASEHRPWSWIQRSPSHQLGKYATDIHVECCEGRAICLRTNPNDDLSREVSWQQTCPRELSQTTFDSIACDRRVMKSWDDQADTRPGSRRKHERGSDDPDLEQCGPNTLPLLRDTLQFRAACNACTPRKGERRVRRLRRRRTYPGYGP